MSVMLQTNKKYWTKSLNYSQQYSLFLDLLISIDCSACFRRFLRPSSGAQYCTYSVRYCQTNTAAIVDEMELHSIIRSTELYIQRQVLSNQYCCLLLLWMRLNCIPSSGAQNCTYSVRYCQTNTAAIVDEIELHSIIRSTELCIQRQVLSNQYCCYRG
jgi:hypothetical protein